MTSRRTNAEIPSTARSFTRAGLTLALLFLASLSGCATQLANPQVSDEELDEERLAQMQLAIERHLERQVRLDRVAKKLAVAGPDLCGEDVDYSFGITWATASALSDEYRPIAPRVGLTGGIQIWATVPGSAASPARIARGTRVVGVNGKPVDEFESLVEALDPSWTSGKLRLELADSSGKPVRDITLRGRKACRYSVLLTESSDVNAWADGDRVFIPEGMMRFADSDDDLALVVGHEIAHNALGHAKEKRVTGGIGRGAGRLIDFAAAVVGIPTGGGFGALGGAASDAATSRRSRDFESDADYMGLYLARRAGYDIENAHLFWREMAVEYPATMSGSMLSSHPSSPERSAALSAAVTEIRSKQKAGKKLVPEGNLVVPANQQD